MLVATTTVVLSEVGAQAVEESVVVDEALAIIDDVEAGKLFGEELLED